MAPHGNRRISASNSLSLRQRSSLRALVDALLPPLPVPNAAVTKDAEKEESNNVAFSFSSATTSAVDPERMYWEHRLSADSAFMNAVELAITEKLSAADNFKMKALLSTLSTAIGTSLVFGVVTQHPFVEWPVSERTMLLSALQTSQQPLKRAIFSASKRLIAGLAYTYVREDDHGAALAGSNAKTNPFWEYMGYPGPPQQQLQFKNKRDKNDFRLAERATKKQRAVKESILSIDPNTTEIECDVVVVGSGAAGCVAASVLSKEAHQKVLVLEKGHYVPPNQLSNLEYDAFDRLYENSGLLTTRNGAISILAGSCLGGGTTVNWSCCLPLSNKVREKWVREHGLEQFDPVTGVEWDRSVNLVLKQVAGSLSDVSGIKHNAANLKLQQGCDKLGYPWATCQQSLKDTARSDAGYICFGDRYGNKNTAVATFLSDAVRQRVKAKVVEQCRVLKILKTTTTDDNGRRRTKATGVQCQVVGTDGQQHILTVRAHNGVVVTAGALQTPCLLQRSGLHNRHIGKHLRLHPVTGVFGLMKETEPPINCFWGAPMTTLCKQFQINDGHGGIIEVPSAHPGLFAVAAPWKTPQEFKGQLSRLKHVLPFLALQPDLGEGSVKLAKDGFTPQIDYVMNSVDRERMLETMRAGLLLLIASGAKEVSTSHIQDTGLVLNHENETTGLVNLSENQLVQDYLSNVTKLSWDDHKFSLFSAHQMGSCRMGTSHKVGAVDANGETFDCDDLFVMDTSVFPTCSAVNPMITVLAMAHMLSSRLALRLRYQDHRIVNKKDLVRAKDLVSQRTELRSSLPGNSVNWRLILLTLWRSVLWLLIALPIAHIIVRSL